MADIRIKETDALITANGTADKEVIVKKNPEEAEGSEDPVKLYESLLRKQKIFKMLELEGYMGQDETISLDEKINKALLDLEEIIKVSPIKGDYEL